MVATPETQASQAFVTSVTGGPTAQEQLSQAFVTVVANLPTAETEVSQAFVTPITGGPTGSQQVSQAFVVVVYKGRPDNRTARAWNYSLDGHEMYVLRLGEEETLVYDQTTGQWATWDSPSQRTFRAHLGQNWIGMTQANYLGGAQTQVVGADDTFGLLWTLDPLQGYDESPIAPEEGQEPERLYFERLVTGGLPMRGRPSPRLNAVFVTLANGSPEFELAAIRLRTSGDSGNTWADHGTVTIQPDQFAQEIHWRSLGLVKAPGRIFEFSDTGATVRIDGVDLNIDLEGRS